MDHRYCCLNPEQRILLEILAEKLSPSTNRFKGEYWKNCADWRSYDSTASILVCSSYLGTEDFMFCGYAGFSCQDRFFCPYCCYRRYASPLEAEFGETFMSEGEAYYLVTGISSDPEETRRIFLVDGAPDPILRPSPGLAQPFAREDYGVRFEAMGDLMPCRLLFEFFSQVMREFTGDGRMKLFSGAVGGPEVSVQLLPLRVIPHANFLVRAHGLSIDDLRKLRKRLRTLMRNCRLMPAGFYPSVACYRLSGREDVIRVCRYMSKPVDLAAAYKNAASLVDCRPAEMAVLNNETNAFLTNLPLLWHNLHRFKRLGICSPNHRDYIGHVTPGRLRERQRDAHRRRLAESSKQKMVLKTASEHSAKPSSMERWEQFIFDEMHRPDWWARRPASRFRRWLQTNPAFSPFHQFPGTSSVPGAQSKQTEKEL